MTDGSAANSDELIIVELRSKAQGLSAIEVAELLGRLTGGLSQGVLITYLTRAFPAVPLKTLIRSAGWNRLCGAGLDDEGFNQMLAQWFPGGKTEADL
jgi:hypothetical protein